MKELKRGGSGNSNLSKEDKLAKQLMLPRRNKNSKKIIIQKKKVGGPVFQKFDVKGGVSKLEKKDDESKNKITPVRPITPKGMLRPKAHSKRDNGMMGMFYSKKDLLRKKKNDSGNNRGKKYQEGETKEEMMYRILKNKGKKKSEPEEEYSLEEEEPEERRDFESYKNKFYRKKEKQFEMPKQKEGMKIQPMVRKSNSMLPSNNQFLPKEEASKEYGRESDVDLMNMAMNDEKSANYLNPYKKHKKNPSSMYGKTSRDSSRKKTSNKSRSMKPKKKALPDPFKDFEEREKKYDKDILREILELEDLFTQDYSRHIDSMVGLVKKDIAMQASIREEKGPMRFEESISKVKKIVQSKRDSLDLMMAAIRRFDDKFEQLKIRKEKMSAYMKGENKSIKYTRPIQKQDQDRMRLNRNMHGPRLGELPTSKSMYGLGMNPSLKPLNSNQKKSSHYEYKYQGFGGRRNGHQKDEGEGPKMNMMMKGIHPNVLKEKMNLHPGSSKELRPIAKDRGKQKFSMLPQMKLKQRNLGDEAGGGFKRKRTDTETTKDLMNDLDFDNDLSLI